MSQELELLERVLLRLGSAETDEQLEANVHKFLGPVLLKIDSPEENIRKRVMEILTHINKRLKSRPQVKVPLETILKLYQDSSSSFLINFAIIYIILGFPRIDKEKQIEITPMLLNGLEGKPETHQDKLLLLMLPLLGSLQLLPSQDVLGLANKPNTKKQLLDLLQDMILLPYGVTSESAVPPGFSNYSFKRATTDNLKAEDLEQLKKGLVRFLCSGVFSDVEIFPVLVCASADTRFSVATPALQELNKICTTLDWTDVKVSGPLYTLFSGNGSKIVDRKTTAVSPRVRQKILSYLLRCRTSAVHAANGLKVIFESLFGDNTNQKCKVLALQFADVFIMNVQQGIGVLAPVLLNGFSKLIGQGSEETSDVQNAAYNAIAKLASVCPQAVNKDVNLIVSYFDHLNYAPSELQTSIREALVALAQAFSWKKRQQPEATTFSFTPNSNQMLLIGLLAEKAESKATIIQNVASVFLTTCFPDFYVPARYLLLLIAGSSPSLKETVTAYLYGNSKKDNINFAYISSVDNWNASVEDKQQNMLSAEQLRIILPGFKEMVEYVHQQAEKKASTKTERNVGKMHLAFTYDVFTEVIDYLRLCLWFSAGINEYPDEEKKAHLIGRYIRANQSGHLDKYIDLVRCMVISRKGFTELSSLYDLLGAAPEIVAPKNEEMLATLQGSLKEISENNRTLIAKNYGRLLAYSNADFEAQLKDLLALQSKSLEHQHGAVLAAANAVYSRLSKMKQEGRLEEVSGEDSWPALRQTVELLVSLLQSPYHLLMKASIEGISLIGSIVKLPLKEGDAETEKMEVDGETVVHYTKSYVLQTLFKHLRSAHSRGQISEESALCLGHLTNGDGEFFTDRVLRGFLGNIKLTKNPSIHIAVAQSLVFTIQGKTIVDESDGAFTPAASDEKLDWLLEQLIGVVTEPYPNSRQACALWLLALVKNCSKREPVLRRRSVLQSAFTDLLSEDSELVQDVASRGLGIIFSICDPDTQNQLSNVLLDQLSGGRRQVQKVTDDTKLFEEGVLGKAPTGGNLTTYKELCSLASDLNQPEMIYQFMQLANHNATWNSKLGAAFGLQSLSKVAKRKIQPSLGKIVPRLFRYKYDPTPKIQNSMISIWDTLVVDSKSTVELYYWAILEDVTNNLTSPEWRTRIACCLAARDLIKRSAGLKLRCNSNDKPASGGGAGSSAMETDQDVPEPELARLWFQLFRVMDDVHEGTRLAAEGTASLLSKVCIHAASSDHGKSGKTVSSSILPLLLETGVTHQVLEIRKLSILTLTSLIDSSGKLIVDHLPTLIPTLIKATGELDSVKLNYLSNMLGSNSGAQEMVDSIRAEAAKQHHTMDALIKCVRFITFEALEKMTPEIVEIMKTTVQLGSKVAAAHFICLVSVQLNKEMTPVAAKYLTACFNGLADRNLIVRKYYASSLGHLVGVAKEQSVSKLFEKLTDAYFDVESSKAKAIPLAVQAINKRHQELLKDFAKDIIPLIFFAMHEEVTEENRAAVEAWREVWTEVSPGDVAIKLNMEPILERLERCFESQSWLLKAQCGNAVKSIANLGASLSAADRQRLIQLVLKNIGGRTYKGKERILQALASLSKNLERDDENADLPGRIVDAAMRECRKEEPIYRTVALRALGEILDALRVDRFEELYNMVWYLMDKNNLSGVGEEEDTKGLTADEKNRQIMVLINLKEAVCEALGKAWPADAVETQEKYQVLFVQKVAESLGRVPRAVQKSLLTSMIDFLEKLRILETPQEAESKEKKVRVEGGDDLDKVLETLLPAIVSISGIPHTGLKKEALNILLILIKKLQTKKDAPRLATVEKTFTDILPNLQKDNSPEIRCRIKEIEDKLKA